MTDQSSRLSPEKETNKGPTFRNMLLTQINRLKKSTDPVDRQLRNYLISIIKDKSYLEESWMAEIEDVEQIHRLVKNGESLTAAVDVIAKKSKLTKNELRDKYAEYKDALIEIDEIFKILPTEDSK